MLSACATFLTLEERVASKNDVSILDSWVNNTIAGETRSVAVVVSNPFPYDVVVKITCECSWNGELYGEIKNKTVEAGMKRTLLVRGFVTNPEQRSVMCVVSAK